MENEELVLTNIRLHQSYQNKNYFDEVSDEYRHDWVIENATLRIKDGILHIDEKK